MMNAEDGVHISVIQEYCELCGGLGAATLSRVILVTACDSCIKLAMHNHRLD